MVIDTDMRLSKVARRRRSGTSRRRARVRRPGGEALPALSRRVVLETASKRREIFGKTTFNQE
jgi:hypothetical protein